MASKIISIYHCAVKQSYKHLQLCSCWTNQEYIEQSCSDWKHVLISDKNNILFNPKCIFSVIKAIGDNIFSSVAFYAVVVYFLDHVIFLILIKAWNCQFNPKLNSVNPFLALALSIWLQTFFSVQTLLMWKFFTLKL